MNTDPTSIEGLPEAQKEPTEFDSSERLNTLLAASRDHRTEKLDLAVLATFSEIADAMGLASLSLVDLAALTSSSVKNTRTAILRLRAYSYLQVKSASEKPGHPRQYRVMPMAKDANGDRITSAASLKPATAAALRIWVEGPPPRTLDEIGKRLDCSRNTARRIVWELRNAERLVKVGRRFVLHPSQAVRL
jgi:hypothetical protein